jgi:hypothetical protein
VNGTELPIAIPVVTQPGDELLVMGKDGWVRYRVTAFDRDAKPWNARYELELLTESDPVEADRFIVPSHAITGEPLPSMIPHKFVPTGDGAAYERCGFEQCTEPNWSDWHRS